MFMSCLMNFLSTGSVAWFICIYWRQFVLICISSRSGCFWSRHILSVFSQAAFVFSSISCFLFCLSCFILGRFLSIRLVRFSLSVKMGGVFPESCTNSDICHAFMLMLPVISFVFVWDSLLLFFSLRIH